ncbi:hypothetical protein AaE_015477 [Aphanomyces astaci]|uniref:Reverse transcriptase domain-containing protein n=1 Tax=Aphanomyces astaci TaxID=112090 RepID=A0A6A4YVW0_APHAT|nr:hypothetical protein AaE_015477 [Aphanomyces astaci]
MDEERPSKAPAEEPRKQNSRPRPRFGPVREEKRPSGASIAPPTWHADKRDEPPERPKPKCLKCQSTAHRVREHPGITDAEVKKLMDDFHQARRRSVNFVSSTKPTNSMEFQASIEDVLTIPKLLLDSGPDETLVSEGLLPRLMLKPYGETTKPLNVTRQEQFKTVTLETSIGPLVLRGLRAWVEEKKMEIDVLIGRPVMERLGFSVDGMLVDALKQRRVWDKAEAGDVDQTSANVKLLQEAFHEDPEDALYAEDVACSTPAMEKPADQDGEIKRILDGKIAEAIQLGLSPAHEGELRRILDDHADVFRLEAEGGVVPVKCALRRYPPAHMEYLKQHVEELKAAGLVYRNNRAKWAAAPRIVTKKVNAWMIPMPWPMPNLDAAMATLVGINVFFTLDWLKGNWQLPLHSSCQMWYSFMTPFGVILMGQTDAVAYCQSVVNQMFGELLYAGVLGWLDDLLGYADSSDKLFVLLDKVLSICGKFSLKLHPKKYNFFLKKATWCGKVISAEGISHSPDRFQGLCALETPTSGGVHIPAT